MNRISSLLGSATRMFFKFNKYITLYHLNNSNKAVARIVMLLAVVLVTAFPKEVLAQSSFASCDIDENNRNQITCSTPSKIDLTNDNIDPESNYSFVFEGATNTVNLINASLVGNISFTDETGTVNDDNDRFDIQHTGSGSIKGNIDFNDGNDQMTINIASNQNFVIDGDISGLETMTKKGGGYFRLANDVTFTSTANEGLKLEDGYLVIARHLNLGGGTLTVENMGKLVFEIEDSSTNFGRVTAATVHFVQSDPVVYAQLSEDAEATEVKTHLSSNGLQLFTTQITSGIRKTTVADDDIKIKSKSSDGTDVVVGTVKADGSASFTNNADGIEVLILPEQKVPATSGSSSTGGSSSSNSAGAILGIGLLAVLLNSFIGDDSSASFGDYYFNTPQSAYIASINERGVMTIKETGNQPYQMWIRTGHTAQPMQMTGVSNTGVSGTEVGVNLYNSDTFYINTSVAPNVAAEVGSLNLAGKGEVYSLNSGWRNDRYFAGMRLSHGEFEVNSIVDNPIVNSALISNAKLRNTQAQLRAGMNLGTGALRFTPSAAVQVGTYESSEHVADSPALEAAIPSYAQDYTSVQLGLKMTSDKWLSFSNGSKWKPQLKFDSIHTDSTDAGYLTLRQSDKAGALSFNTNAGLRSMPEVVNSMSFGAKVKSSTNDQAEWKFGFAGLEADGEEYYAAMAAYQVKF